MTSTAFFADGTWRGPSRFLAVMVAAAGSVGLLGWTFGLTSLESVLPGLATMKANTAFAFVLSGLSLLTITTEIPRFPAGIGKRLAALAAVAALAIGVASLAESAFGVDLRIDQLVFVDSQGNPPGRPSPVTAALFALSGASLLMMLGKHTAAVAVGQAVAVVVLYLATASVLGYAYGVQSLYAVVPFSSIAINTAVSFMALAVGILLARSGQVPIAALLRDLPSARLARQLLVTIAIALPLIGWIRLKGQQSGLYGDEFGLALTVSASMFVLAIATWIGVHAANRAEESVSRLKRLYAALSRTNQTIINRGDVRSCYEDVCRAVVEDGGFRCAMIAQTGVDRMQLVPMAAAGEIKRQMLQALRAGGDDPEYAQEVVDLVWRNTPAFVNDISSSPMTKARRAALDRLGIRSKAVLPITVEGRPCAVLLVYSRYLGMFRPEEQALLLEMAADLGFALEQSERDNVRRMAMAEIQALNQDLERRVGERTAELREANLELEGASIAKSNFLSMMSHEIRTPMNGVLGMLELLALSELGPQQRTTLEIVRESGRALLRIIDDILDFSKIEAGKLEIRPEVASIAKVVASVAGIYSGSASSKALVLTADTDPGISPAVVVDPLRLRQILNNLVNNAIKFTSKGSVEIRARLVGRKDGKDIVSIAVVDTGVGVSPEGQALLFQPFSQADGEIARSFGGTGLGLSICRRLAQLMGGSLELASRVGNGTTVTLTLALPIADPSSLPASDGEHEQEAIGIGITARRKAPSAAGAESEGTLVLVADDHPINRLLLMRQVTVLGYACEAAEDGREALDLWKSGRFSLVITDCNMPEMDGYELTRAIRALEAGSPRRRTSIIACTANALKGEADKCYAAGMDDYIAKPVELSQLLAKLEQWLPVQDAGRIAAREADARARPSALPIAEASPPAFDRRVLAEVSGGDPALEQDLLLRFRHFNTEDRRLLLGAVERRDMDEVIRVSHRIHGASKMIGATGLAEASARLERASRANDWSAIASNLESFWREYDTLDGRIASAENPQ